MTTAPSPTAPAVPRSRLRTYASFVRFEHTLFSLPLVLAGVFSVPGPALTPARWGLIAVAAVGARTTAMALNRLIDRRLDALNPRTQQRELPAGRMRLVEAWLLLVVSALAYVVACAALGRWFLEVAAIPLVVFAVYPYLKRWTPLCHLGVGLALALAPLAGYAAAHPDLGRPGAALWLAGFALLWVSGFDIIYATLDEDSDRLHRVRSMVTWLGRERALVVSGVLHAAAFAGLVMAAVGLLAGAPFIADWGLPAVIAALTATGVLLFLEQRWASDVDLAFFRVNIFVGAGVLATVLVARAACGF
ncbi:MAG: 4-hydroxybenzoate octaprenyltransferase [Candidatus Eisenbacteria bacterium]|uniref:4-hydroxybenzoate octaprenyltransferase n=1 Tax=Eiseniibacteriota bacterium TaxID=2212470 RepID=A0A538UBZ3_UNCEI|nr:MAG: 4-hydroxybenzoate octaprenyltransferase [Candidatus Eisenbacteria bacterium]